MPRTAPSPRRLGRPPASDAHDTRQRILDGARAAFAEHGYDATTNRELAVAAGITTGALYHYFDAKLDIYIAVHADAQQRVYTRFTQAVAGTPTFIGGIQAVLDAAHEMNSVDPTLAQFLGAVRVDMHRHPELRTVLQRHARRRRGFFDELVERGIETGEIDVTDRERAQSLVRAMLIGLNDAVSDDLTAHRLAVEGLKLLLEGKLLKPVD
jgi:AcrR family transcriptional regulator